MHAARYIDGGEGVGLRAAVHGDPTPNPPLVLVHGFMGSAAGWGPLAARLAARRQVIAPDLVGHGGSWAPSDPAEYAVERVAERLARLAEALGASGADWLGYSMGGRILLAGVAGGVIRPRRLILESTTPGLEGEAERAERRAADEDRARRLVRDGIEPFVDGWLGGPLFATLPGAVRPRARAVRLGNRPEAMAAALRGGGTGSQPSQWPHLARITVPTLLITGDLDRKFTRLAHRMAAALPHAVPVSVAGAGHAVHLEVPEQWLEATEAWLAPGARDPGGWRGVGEAE